MERLGFETLQRTADVSNYLLKNLRIDFVHARRAYSRAVLERASKRTIEGVDLFIAAPEDLVGLKLQALVNDPSRVQDRADIEGLLRDSDQMDMDLVREYFGVFDREHELDQILEAIRSRRTRDEG